MGYDAKEEWSKTYSTAKSMAFPAEYVIRIFKGSYPNLDFNKDSFEGKKICDLGCGDGRNLFLLSQCGFDIYGMEISEEIVNKALSNLSDVNLEADIRVGANHSISFDDRYFDFLLSWNSCYYMGINSDFEKHLVEFSRVLKEEGYLVLSIPKKSCFLYKDSEYFKSGYRIIRSDPFELRNGEVLRMFEDEQEIEQVFTKYFKNFIFASINDDCFGYDYHWHLVVCQKR